VEDSNDFNRQTELLQSRMYRLAVVDCNRRSLSHTVSLNRSRHSLDTSSALYYQKAFEQIVFVWTVILHLGQAAAAAQQ
jgi:hypothetical protein